MKLFEFLYVINFYRCPNLNRTNLYVHQWVGVFVVNIGPSIMVLSEDKLATEVEEDPAEAVEE